MNVLTGIAVSPGIVWGPAALLVQDSVTLRYAVAPANVGREVARLDAAREATRHQLERIHARVLAAAGPDLRLSVQGPALHARRPAPGPQGARDRVQRTTQCRVGRGTRLRGVLGNLHGCRRRVHPGTSGRRGRRGGAAAEESGNQSAPHRRVEPGARRAIHPCGRRTGAVGRRSAGSPPGDRPGDGCGKSVRIIRRFSPGRCACRPSQVCGPPHSLHDRAC